MKTTTAGIEIKQLTHETEAWNRYAQESDMTTLYHLAGWKRVLEKTFGHATYYLYALRNGRIVGLLPLVFLKSLIFGKFMVSLPFVNYAGVIAEDADARTALIDAAIRIARQNKAEHIELRHLAHYDIGLPTKTSKVLMVLDLPATSDELWKSFKSKLRSQIKRPGKEGFTVKFGQLEELESFYDVFTQNMRDLGTPVYTKRLFENILQEFSDSAGICTVYDGSTPIASGFIIGFKGLLQIPWASSIRAYNRFSPNMLLYWNILKRACEEGYSQFDFGRSTPNEGTYKFKRQWGAVPKPCYWQYWLASGEELPEINPHNPRYALMIKTWQRLPLAVTKLLGPGIVKNIP